ITPVRPHRNVDMTHSSFPLNLVTRTQWGAIAPRHKDCLKSSAERVVIHHTAMRNCKSNTDFLVGQDGTVYEGRGWGVVGAHTKGHNADSLGIALMGNFDCNPSSEALMSVKQLLKAGVSQGFLFPQFVLFGHRDLGNTKCPGAKLYAALPQLRSAK
uniref:Peptidoglycan recognition protein 5 n=1 Tax=Neogobius melanostomus TaxID=47308 RepID=A0A8C6THJ4_9GOBI